MYGFTVKTVHSCVSANFLSTSAPLTSVPMFSKSIINALITSHGCTFPLASLLPPRTIHFTPFIFRSTYINDIGIVKYKTK